LIVFDVGDNFVDFVDIEEVGDVVLTFVVLVVVCGEVETGDFVGLDLLFIGEIRACVVFVERDLGDVLFAVGVPAVVTRVGEDFDT
jgi:hypothetical protein